MAKLKLMKKEWFDWFKNTTLDNITAWTEYYYINPDSQHWISNYQIWNGYCTQNSIDSVTGLPTTSKTRCLTGFIKVNPSTYYYFMLNNAVSGQNIYEIHQYDDNQKTIRVVHYPYATTYSFKTDVNCHYIRVLLRFTDNRETLPSDWINKLCVNVSNPTFNGHYEPYIIKIEDILGVIALKDLSWERQAENIFAASRESLPDDMPSYSPSDPNAAKMFNPVYRAVPPGQIYYVQTDMAIGLSSVLRVKDKRFDNIDDFTDFVQDQYLVYLKTTSPIGQ